MAPKPPNVRSAPGNPRSDRRSSSRNRPASRFDSPSLRRRRVTTLRDPNDGRFCPATFLSCPSVLLSTSRSRMISPSKVTRGVISMLTPTGR